MSSQTVREFFGAGSGFVALHHSLYPLPAAGCEVNCSALLCCWYISGTGEIVTVIKFCG